MRLNGIGSCLAEGIIIRPGRHMRMIVAGHMGIIML